jgi:hypothetical protein
MNTRKATIEIICFILLMNWFYEGIYKVVNWGNFSSYMRRAPLIHPIWQILSYAIPLAEVGLALLFLFPKQRQKALYLSIGVLLVYVFWVMTWHFFAFKLFWPFHAIWSKPNWTQKMLMSLGLCWVAFIAVVFSAPRSLGKILKSNANQNRAASLGG